MNLAQIATCAVALTALSASCAQAAPALATNNVNMRQGPGTNYPVITTIPGGSTVEVSGCQGEWCSVSWHGQSGFTIAARLDLGGGAPPPSGAQGPPPGSGGPMPPPGAGGPPPGASAGRTLSAAAGLPAARLPAATRLLLRSGLRPVLLPASLLLRPLLRAVLVPPLVVAFGASPR
jgi:hypothetical protein